MTKKTLYCWARRGKGYEISSRGDKRFSALFAKMPDGRSIEQHYQCDTKGYQPGGTDWRLGKGKPPLDKGVDLWEAYLGLWRVWVERNPVLFDILTKHASLHGCRLTDMFASSPVNQARALCELLNEHHLKE